MRRVKVGESDAEAVADTVAVFLFAVTVAVAGWRPRRN
jgi:hypothetical protein